LTNRCALFRISDVSWSSRIGEQRYDQFLEFMEQAAADASHGVTDLDLFIGKINCAVQSMTSLMGFKLFAGSPSEKNRSVPCFSNGAPEFFFTFVNLYWVFVIFIPDEDAVLRTFLRLRARLFP